MELKRKKIIVIDYDKFRSLDSDKFFLNFKCTFTNFDLKNFMKDTFL